jgi:prolyl 4-hydroxylase
MVYVSVEDGLLGGGTNFPLLDVFMDERLCEFVECDEDGSGKGDGQGSANGEERKGVTFKPIERNAIYWENLRSDGSGYPETWHAGLPVKNGTKVGLNIWSWYQF